MKKIYALPTLKNLPQGVRIVEVGDAEVMQELFANFALAMVAGVLMVFAVLVLLFARVFQPITILSRAAAVDRRRGAGAAARRACRCRCRS